MFVFATRPSGVRSLRATGFGAHEPLPVAQANRRGSDRKVNRTWIS